MSRTIRDYWSILNIHPGADEASIKRAFRQQARQWHPDLNKNNPEAEERFKQINEAYAVLSDKQRRLEWEQNYFEEGLYNQLEDTLSCGFPDFQSYTEVFLRPINDNQQYVDSNEKQENDQSKPLHKSQVDLSSEEIIVNLTPEQAIYGSCVEVSLNDGVIVNIETPPFAGHGWYLRLPQMGNSGMDQFCQLNIETSEGLQINGLNIMYYLELSPANAALGCEVVVPTLDGYARIEVPQCSSSGDLLRLKGEGLSKKEQQGDQLLEIRIMLPQTLNATEKQIYKELQNMNSQSI